jgi:hypothetical protein
MSATLKLSNFEQTDSDRAYIAINDIFDLRILKTENGVIVKVFPRGDPLAYPIASLQVFDSQGMEE